MLSAIGRMCSGICGGTAETHSMRSPRVMEVASARFLPHSTVERALAFSLVPPHSSQGRTVRYLSTLWIPFSVLALFRASSTARRALR